VHHVDGEVDIKVGKALLMEASYHIEL